ncbi:hypothetical protein GIB67_021442 [Kingdonia uniflora]|uniref:Uncharacterized protein n=1 Tax=Kingdonia uniflora TaxID=39325 RepID=A0A7J7NQJ0_9MAGN|nr:hypothetical protein GIB67_021442 [Kingdonia uniflora]
MAHNNQSINMEDDAGGAESNNLHTDSSGSLSKDVKCGWDEESEEITKAMSTASQDLLRKRELAWDVWRGISLSLDLRNQDFLIFCDTQNIVKALCTRSTDVSWQADTFYRNILHVG